MQQIGIIDYGVGNISSVKNAVEFVGGKVTFLKNPNSLDTVDKIILPGVGAFESAMNNLVNAGWDEAIKIIADKKPLLGLCLGMQLLLEESEEYGLHKGLGLVQGSVKSLKTKVGDLTVPHMGWNQLSIKRDNPLTLNLDTESNDVYFVHSFYCDLLNKEDVLATTHYGFEFDVMLQKGNVFGCQFHPEKSQKNGLKILENFLNF